MTVIPISEPHIGQLELDFVTDAVRSGWVSSIGPFIDKFELEFAKFCEVEYAISVSNGTNALHLLLVASGIGPGDEVIIPDLTFVATANAVRYCGATPVIVDIDLETLCISPSAFGAAITNRTKAVMPVHLYGQPCDMDSIREIASVKNILVFEDAAEAHGALYKGQKVGSISDAGVFSFYGNKIMTTGEGGVITTNNPILANRLKFLRDHAMSKEHRYWHDEVGYNYRLTNIQAALGCAQLQQVDSFISKRIEIYNWYSSFLKNDNRIKLNAITSWAKSVFWMPSIEIYGYGFEERDKLISRLKSRGVDSRPFFYPLTSMPPYEDKSRQKSNALTASARGINLPSFFGLEKSKVEYISRVLLEEL